MNREQAKARLPIFQAFCEGKTIQHDAYGDGKWIDLMHLHAFFEENENVSRYRVKPEPKQIWVNEYPDVKDSQYPMAHWSAESAERDRTPGGITKVYRQVMDE